MCCFHGNRGKQRADVGQVRSHAPRPAEGFGPLGQSRQGQEELALVSPKVAPRPHISEDKIQGSG